MVHKSQNVKLAVRCGLFFCAQKVLTGVIKIGPKQAWEGRGMDKFPRKGERENASDEDHNPSRKTHADRPQAYRGADV